MISEVEKLLHVPAAEILGRSRIRKVVEARHAYWWLLSNNGFSRSQTGRLCEVDQSTTTNGISRFLNLLETGDTETVRIYNLIKNIKL
jgi:hypothetical protein